MKPPQKKSKWTRCDVPWKSRSGVRKLSEQPTELPAKRLERHRRVKLERKNEPAYQSNRLEPYEWSECRRAPFLFAATQAKLAVIKAFERMHPKHSGGTVSSITVAETARFASKYMQGCRSWAA